MNVVKIPSAVVIIEMGKECVMDILVAEINLEKFYLEMIRIGDRIVPAKEMIRNDDDFLVNTCLFCKRN